uniref:Odorant receptor n=1 Tax=Eogystia hippophaecolus TaxID=1206364 RepID=A0A1B3P5R3_EOGHI|nr:odorant receptor [Eogystia hippophaecolus]
MDTEVVQKLGCKDSYYLLELKKSITHFDEVGKFCALIQQVFSVALFLQFSMSSCIICVCLFRCTLRAPLQYYIFLSTYMFIMVIQIMVPCWFGTRVIEKSYLLTRAIYDCDWISRSPQFKSNLRFFIVRANRPLSITGGKMFLLSVATFTSIMNTAYSFFTLLRHMQSR